MLVTPRFYKKNVSENFEFSRDITIPSELRFGNGIYIYPTNLELNNTIELLTEIPQHGYIKCN